MAYRLQAFSDVGLNEASLALALREHETRTLPRLERLWTYYRNALEPVARAGTTTGTSSARWYSQPQEVGLPSRLTRPGNAASDDRLRSPRELVIENDIAWRLHAMVDFLFAKPIRFISTARTPAIRKAVESALDAIWETSGGISLFTDLSLLAHVFGHVDLLVRITETATDFRRRARMHNAQPLDILRTSPPVRIEVIDPRRGMPISDTSDFRRLSAYIIHFQREEHAPENSGPVPGFLRSLIGAPPGRRKRTTHTEIISADFHHTYENERVLSAEETPWTHGRLPIVHIQNVSQPFHYSGISEVEPLIPLQDELNTRLSDRAYRLAMQSFKMYLFKGLGSPDSLAIGPGVMITTDDTQASIQTFGGDAEAPSEDAHFEAIRNALDKLSGVPPLATGVVQGKVGNLSSAMALRVTLMGLLSRTARKQVTYGRGLAEASRLILAALDHLDILKTDEIDRAVRIDWPDPLPTDDREQTQTAETKLRIGVDKQRVLEELGYTPTDDGAV
ncbi:MAG: phage portal protein [Phycisphaeraceae bacterium]|nr:phage portal protein [Phycisphaeraceae bacterium]